jgi:hypothetical protein
VTQNFLAPPAKAPTEIKQDSAALTATALHAIQEKRRAAGLKPLKVDRRLTRAANLTASWHQQGGNQASLARLKRALGGARRRFSAVGTISQEVSSVEAVAEIKHFLDRRPRYVSLALQVGRRADLPTTGDTCPNPVPSGNNFAIPSGSIGDPPLKDVSTKDTRSRCSASTTEAKQRIFPMCLHCFRVHIGRAAGPA